MFGRSCSFRHIRKTHGACYALQAAAEAIGASLAVGQTGVVEAANSAAFSTSNSSAIATANATAIALAADNGTCTSYPAQSYAAALSSVLDANDTEAAAAGIAAGFAQGCCVSSATALSVVDLIAIDGCTSILGGILLSKCTIIEHANCNVLQCLCTSYAFALSHADIIDWLGCWMT